MPIEIDISTLTFRNWALAIVQKMNSEDEHEDKRSEVIRGLMQ